MTADIIDFTKVKEKMKQEEEEFTYKSYIDDLKYVQSVFHLLEPSAQYQIFMQSTSLLIALVETAIKEQGLE